jgi:hypothetical protein
MTTRVRAHGKVVKRPGHWTRGASARRGGVAGQQRRAGPRRIVLCGELRSAEVRVHRGGIAILSAMSSRQYLADARQARRQGRLPVIDDPAR